MLAIDNKHEHQDNKKNKTATIKRHKTPKHDKQVFKKQFGATLENPNSSQHIKNYSCSDTKDIPVDSQEFSKLNYDSLPKYKIDYNKSSKFNNDNLLNPGYNYTLQAKPSYYSNNIILISNKSECTDNKSLTSQHSEKILKPKKNESFFSANIIDRIEAESNSVKKIIDLKRELKQTRLNSLKKQLTLNDSDDENKLVKKSSLKPPKNRSGSKDDSDKEDKSQIIPSSPKSALSRNSSISGKSNESSKRVSFKNKTEVHLVQSYKEFYNIKAKDENNDNTNLITKAYEKSDKVMKNPNKNEPCSCCIIM